MSTTNNSSDVSTQQKILEAAEKEFMDKGYAGARTVKIAENAGVTHAMLHYYFRTKEQLFNMIITNKLDLLVESCLSIFSDTSLPIGDRIEKGMSAHFDLLVKNPSLPRFLVNDGGSINAEILKPYLPRLMNIISDISKEVGSDVDPLNLVFDVIGMNIFPFLVMPLVSRAYPAITGQNLSDNVLESIKQENIKVIKKRLGIQ